MSTGPLVGRVHECGILDQLISATRSGRGGALVLHGEAGLGKTALLDRVAVSAVDLRVFRIAGVQAEQSLPFAAVHQLCGPMLDRLGELPAPQREALSIAFGLADGQAPDRFLVGVAVLGLLSGGCNGAGASGARSPLVCLIDDAQFLDRASAQALAFAARRVETEPVLLIFASREMTPDLSGLPHLHLEGLADNETRQLLAATTHWPIDERVRDQIVAETHGNPLALKQLPHVRWPARLAGDFVMPPHPVRPNQIEEEFRRRLAVLPSPARKLLLLAAADPVGDPAVVWHAARHLGIPREAATAAAEAGLLEFGTRARFPHPLARSAAYRLACLLDRQEAHRALAQAVDARTDPDRRAWHLAQATQAPDDEVAAELLNAAGRARARGGLAAAAAFLERAATLTSQAAPRAERALGAADTTVRAGVFGPAEDLLTLASTVSLDDSHAAHVDLVRARFDHLARHGGDVVTPLLAAAERFERIDIDQARLACLDAFGAAFLAGRLAADGATAGDVARAAARAPAPRHQPWACDLLLDGLAAYWLDDGRKAVALLRQAVSAIVDSAIVEADGDGTGDRTGENMPAEAGQRCQWLAGIAAILLWDDAAWDELTGRQLRLTRETGALSELPLALTCRVWLELMSGELTTAATLAEELDAVTEATGNSLAPYGSLCLMAFAGDEGETCDLADKARRDAQRRGEGLGVAVAGWAKALLFNGHGRYEQARAAAEPATTPLEPGPSAWALAEWVEAAARSGHRAHATQALRRLSGCSQFLGTPWALGVLARSRAMLAAGRRAERLYAEAIECLAQTRMRVELARAHLAHGEWLRRENRRVDARDQLHIALEMFGTMGLEAFADRAWRELAATGETVRKRKNGGPNDLTAQETRIAVLASDGLSNPEISLQLFISARTVEWHLRKVFTKLGITSRRQLRSVLPEALRAANGSGRTGAGAARRDPRR